MFRVTYEIVTPESAEHGDCAERGFIGRFEIRWPIEEAPDSAFDMPLRQALDYCYPQEDSGSCLSEVDGRQNYQTGAEERRSLHPPDNITAASYQRLKRLCNVR